MKVLLNDGWSLRGFDRETTTAAGTIIPAAALDDDAGWLPAEVPGDVHSTLLRHSLIEDPFYDTNAEKCRWVEEKVWWYRKEFVFDRTLNGDEILELKFHGLDTFATVFLNGEQLGAHANMFTPAVFEVTKKVKPGRNLLLVRFDPVVALTENQDYSRMWYSYNRNRVWVRKCQMNFRWDWCPRLITAGLWKDVELQVYKQARIESVFFYTENISENRDRAAVGVTVETVAEKGLDLKLELTLAWAEETVIQKRVACRDRCTTVKMAVDHPRLWWTHDLGAPNLYRLTVRLKADEEVLDTYTTEVGIRTITVKQKDDTGANRFTFVLNGVELFAKGANWVPAHSLPGTIKDETYIRWIATAQNCRMNMLRVWGGGIYEREVFYRECDRRGILVWQDFMFSCSSYPDFDPGFMANVRAEVVHVVKALRSHPSLALWCGNNEIQWLHGQKLAELTDMRLYGERIFHELIPELLGDLDPTRLYWPSSPFGGNDPNSEEEGDKHNWQVWAGQVYPHRYGEPVRIDNTPAGTSFKNYTRDLGKFISEFGIQAAPVRRTLQSCLPPAALSPDSFSLRYRNKDKHPDRGKLLMQSFTGLPKNFDEYIDYSMLTQAEGLKFGIEHYRRRKPDCSGTLIWQLNDCWPAISWSLVDFYLRPKAAWYFVRRAYHPVLFSFKEEDGQQISLWGTNDTLADYRDRLEVGLKDFFGHTEYKEEFDVLLPANSARKIREFSRNRLNVTYTNFEFLYVRPGNKGVGANLFFFKDFKDLNLPPCHLTITQPKKTGDTLEVSIKTDYFAKFIRIDCPRDDLSFSDNYFDLMPGEEKTVWIEQTDGLLPEELALDISALNSASG